MRSFLTFVVFAASLLVVGTKSQPPPIPPPGLYCCPKTGPKGLPLQERQVGPYAIYCWYSSSDWCVYNPATGGGSTIPDCPATAPANPHPPTCPI